ncbi:hypothetical protein [Fluviispira sanaruensis]|nr:hypothetical protein [Fluviispira sanaruensis]
MQNLFCQQCYFSSEERQIWLATFTAGLGRVRFMDVIANETIIWRQLAR